MFSLHSKCDLRRLIMTFVRPCLNVSLLSHVILAILANSAPNRTEGAKLNQQSKKSTFPRLAAFSCTMSLVRILHL